MARHFKTRKEFYESIVRLADFLQGEFGLSDEEVDGLVYDMPGGTEATLEDTLDEMCDFPSFGD